MLRSLLRLSSWIDKLGERIGRLANLMILFSCIVSASNALVRYGFDWSNNWPLELQWYLFGASVMLGASYTFQKNEHVRVDLVYGHVSKRTQLWIDIFGVIAFLLPACLLFSWLSWKSLFLPSWDILEQSANAGGLPRYPIKLIVPVGFAALALQGLSELIKRIAAIAGITEFDATYERPVQ
ncbi:TRAP-type mannitol/chloroaromatic compound transport system, small permease component [Noviherbaspirillum humi]|uniref:TRAP transporter small permease protein n=1 Tax=Noviherbaspirillum humi TaxID=1688639 RepID=A0A239FMR2_9BURK|nr:TRAP transporter small permease subunit [Noviherbaspirillum humi]SNS58127.1 TRAP-type mannitol/chloroaromatic compound transport system, small permease component [Noviherbaspirillum humi]